MFLLADPPLEGFSPDDALRWLEAGVADDALADAYALVSDHVADLMWTLGARDPWAGEAIDRWAGVEICEDMRRQGCVPSRCGV